MPKAPGTPNNTSGPDEQQITAVMILLAVVLLFVFIYIFILVWRPASRDKSDTPGDPENMGRLTTFPEVQSDPVSAEDPSLTFEDMSTKQTRGTDADYRNDRVLSCEVAYGMHFQLGIEEVSLNDAIYLNPQFSYDFSANPTEQYGFIFLTDRNPVTYCSSDGRHRLEGVNRAQTMLAITGRTFDRYVPSSFTSVNDYGVRWMNSSLYDGEEDVGTTLYVRIIRLADGYLMATARADIIYDEFERAYCLENLRRGDVLENGELTIEQRTEIINQAVTYLYSGNTRYALSLSEDHFAREYYDNFIIVEHPPRLYYNKILDTSGQVVAAGRYANCDIYAVHIPYNGFCFFTVYFAPEPQVHGMNADRYPGENLNLQLIGTDLFNPLSAESLQSLLLAEDAEKIGLD